MADFEFESAHQAVFNLIAEHEDIDVLLQESSATFNPLFVGSPHCQEVGRQSVDGLLSAVETRCMVTGSPAAVVAAVTLGGKLRMLLSAESVAETHSVLTAESRDQLLTIIEVCRRLQLGPGFSQKVFVKTLCKDSSEMLNLEGLWRLQEAGLLTMELYVVKNLTRPMLVKNLAKGIVNLCTSQESGDGMLDLRKQIVSGLVVSLLDIESTADATDNSATDNVSKGLRKVSSALLDSITKKIIQVTAKCDFSPFDGLHLVELATRRRYCSRQLNVLLSSNAVLKVSDALRDQHKWTSLNIDSHLHTVYQQLLEPFDAVEVVEHICRALKHQEVNWKCLLSLTAVTLTTCLDASRHVQSVIDNFLRHAMTDCNQESLVAGVLLARQSCLEGQHVFKSYEDWFQTSFGSSKTSLCSSKKSFAFLVQFLSEMVPYETGHYIKVHITRPPFVPGKCRPLWSDYVTLARTRLMDLKESLDDQATSHDAVPQEKAQLVESDVEKALSSFEKNFKVPSSVMEASIFRKPYYVGRFLPTLLQPRPLPDVPDLKMRFIESLMKSGKIPETLYSSYEQQCKRMAADILEGVSFEDDINMEEELSMSVEEQLQCSLDSLRDDVIKQHIGTQPTAAAQSASYVRQLTSISEKLSAVTSSVESSDQTVSSTELIVIDINSVSSDCGTIKVAQMLLNTIGETVTRLLNAAVKRSDGSWLTQLLLMLRSHAVVLRTLCAVVCHLLTTQASTLSECHAHALAAVLVHWNKYPGCSAGIRIRHTARNEPSARVAGTTPLVSYILESLPLSTTVDMSFSLVFAVSYITYVQMIDHSSFPGENQMLPDQESARSVDECNIIPDHLKQLLSYLGPRLIKGLRSRSSNLGSTESTVLRKFSSVQRLLSNELVGSLLEQSQMSLETWVQKEIEVVDDGDLSSEWLSEYYSWVVFTRWHKPQFITRSAGHVISVLQVLARAVLEFDTRYSPPSTCCCRETSQQHKQLRQNGRHNVFNLLQKLSQFSCYDEASDDTVPWMWAVLEQCTAGRPGQHADSDLSAVSDTAQVAAWFRLMAQLPSTAVVTLRRSPTTQVRGLDQLRNAVNDRARNVSDTCVLSPDLTLHLVLTLASLPVDVNDDLRRFLSDCPLITLSAMLHSTTADSAVNMARCSNAMTDVLGTVALALDEASSLLSGASRPGPSTTTAWLRGAALWSRLYNRRYGLDASRLRTDPETAESLLHWSTLELAAGMLRGDDSQTVEDIVVAVWQHHVDALHCLSDSDDEQSPTVAVFRRCVPDILQRMQPLACLHLFTRAVNGDFVGRLTSCWNVTRTLRWYVRCVQLFDSGHCAVANVLTVLQQASTAICQFSTKMPRSQIRAVDQATLDAVDPHIRILFQQMSSV